MIPTVALRRVSQDAGPLTLLLAILLSTSLKLINGNAVGLEKRVAGIHLGNNPRSVSNGLTAPNKHLWPQTGPGEAQGIISHSISSSTSSSGPGRTGSGTTDRNALHPWADSRIGSARRSHRDDAQSQLQPPDQPGQQQEQPGQQQEQPGQQQEQPGQQQEQPGGKHHADGDNPVLPGQPVASFTVDTPTGPFSYEPSTSKLPVVVMVFNPQDPFQRVMWSGRSLQMFLRQAPLAAADYLFVPYVYSPAAAADVAYYMYREMIGAAREVYGSNDTTDEDLRRRVFGHFHFSLTPAMAMSPQILQLLRRWNQDMRVLHVRRNPGPPPSPSTPPSPSDGADSAAVAAAAAATAIEEARADYLTQSDMKSGTQRSIKLSGVVEVGTLTAAATAAAAAAPPPPPPTDGLTVGRLDAWYGWLPSPAVTTPNPAPFVAFDEVVAAATRASANAEYGTTATSAGVPVSKPSPCELLTLWNSPDAADGGSSPGGGYSRGVDRSSSSSSRLRGQSRFDGAWVLVSNRSREDHPDCSYSDIILNLQRAGALGVVFAASPGSDVEVVITPEEYDSGDGPEEAVKRDLYDTAKLQFGFGDQLSVQHQTTTGDMAARAGGAGEEEEEEEEEEQPCIAATMVSYDDGLDLLTLLTDAARDNVTAEVAFRVKPIPVGWFVIDPWVGLAEAGWAQLPLMMHAGWAAWWHVYLGRLRQRLDELRGNAADSHIVTIFRDQPFPGPHGAHAAASLPRRLPYRFRRLLLDFSLACPGPTDASCPAWDHMVQLFACCDPQPSRCRPCPTTLCRPRPRPAAAEPVPDGAVPPPSTPGSEQRCGLELGRWATPFRRRVGRWLTDVTPLMGLLGDGGRCSFTVQTAPWADGNWTANLSLVLVRHAPAGREVEEDGRGGSGAHPTAPRVSGQQAAPQVSEVSEDRSPYATPPKRSRGEGVEGASTGSRADELERQQQQLTRSSSNRATDGSGRGDGNDAGGRKHRRRRRHLTMATDAATEGEPRVRAEADAVGGSSIPFGAATVAAGAVDAAAAVAASSGVTEARAQPFSTAAPRPIAVLPLFESAVFDASYNRDRAAVTLATPAAIRGAAVVSYITGHGSDAAAGCGEFCPTSHHLFINGREIAVLNFTKAGTAWGCADAVLYGGVPNQHGTWFYGRGGWCDGAAVDPWVVDVSDWLRPPGSAVNNTIWIKGLYGDHREPADPLPGTMAGYIMMQSVLVLYG